MGALPALEAYGLTDPGRRRRNNEDAVAVEPALGLVVVADGMGGHQAGEVASTLAVEALCEFVRRARTDPDLTWPFGVESTRSFIANCLATGIRMANRRVYREARNAQHLAGMGTTLVAVLVGEGRFAYAGLGDSRVYLLRGGNLRQLTRDDSWIETALARHLVAPAERASHPMRHVLTKAVGLAEDVDFEVREEPARAGDVLLLCSDGLTGVVPDPEIRALLHDHAGDLRRASAVLVERANAAGGPDNVTVALLRIL